MAQIKEAGSAFREVNGEATDLLIELHNQMDRGHVDLKFLMERYLTKYPLDGPIRLIFDIKKTHDIYQNLYEEIKRMDFGSAMSKVIADKSPLREGRYSDSIFPYAEGELTRYIYDKYVGLGLVPEGHLPATRLYEYIRDAWRNLKQLWHVGIDIVRSYDRELTSALRLEPDTTITFQVQITVDGGIILGRERTISGV
jgi:hypothetical protein